MTLSDSKIFNDKEHHAAAMWQLSMLY